MLKLFTFTHIILTRLDYLMLLIVMNTTGNQKPPPGITHTYTTQEIILYKSFAHTLKISGG